MICIYANNAIITLLFWSMIKFYKYTESRVRPSSTTPHYKCASVCIYVSPKSRNLSLLPQGPPRPQLAALRYPPLPSCARRQLRRGRTKDERRA